VRADAWRAWIQVAATNLMRGTHGFEPISA
jgi:hypothetical protein